MPHPDPQAHRPPAPDSASSPLAPTPGWRLVRRPHGHVDFVDGAGKVFSDVDVLRAFPVTAPQGPVAIVSADGDELAWLDSLENLPEALQSSLVAELATREFLPLIERIEAISDDDPPAPSWWTPQVSATGSPTSPPSTPPACGSWKRRWSEAAAVPASLPISPRLPRRRSASGRPLARGRKLERLHRWRRLEGPFFREFPRKKVNKPLEDRVHGISLGSALSQRRSDGRHHAQFVSSRGVHFVRSGRSAGASPSS